MHNTCIVWNNATSGLIEWYYLLHLSRFIQQRLVMWFLIYINCKFSFRNVDGYILDTLFSMLYILTWETVFNLFCYASLASIINDLATDSLYIVQIAIVFTRGLIFFRNSTRCWRWEFTCSILLFFAPT